MTEWALAHPWMTLVIALFAITAIYNMIISVLRVIVAIAWRKKTGSLKSSERD